jgi:AcrR family transcriptional regulator
MCDTATVGKRQDARDRIERRIIELARRQLATDGAAGLSVRAIARDLGMVSSAVYRYVASRDELLTMLLIDAYTELADAVDAARTPDGEWDEQILAMAHAARTWAVADPARWALLYGSPVPGYHAPADQTVGPGTRVVGSLLAAVDAGIEAGRVPQRNTPVPPATARDFDGLREEFGFSGDDASLLGCLTLWAGLIGAISLEVFGQYGPDTFGNASPLFDGQVRLLTGLLAT